MSGSALIEAVKTWAPKAMVEHYTSSGMETLFKNNKVSPDAFAKWVQDNTPSIEVKKLIPGVRKQSAELYRIQHELESLGYSADAGVNEGLVHKAGDDSVLYLPAGAKELLKSEPNAYYKQAPAEHNDLIKRFYELADSQFGADFDNNDAATGRYGVEPIRVEEMDRPSDILVREPTKGGVASKLASGYEDLDSSYVEPFGVKFKGPHFGKSDTNVLASIRGYFPTTDQYFAFEVQSDWAQTRNKQLAKRTRDYLEHKGLTVDEVFTPNSPVGNKLKSLGVKASDKVDDRIAKLAAESSLSVAPNSALLESYETLAIKTAIKHALENGATKIVIPDAKTITMIEGHDQYVDPNSNPKKIRQFDGMVQHYERNLPSILKRLTGDSGRPVELGKFTNREPSIFFEGKDTITGREYDLTNLSPEVEKLFSIYGQADQYDYAASLAKAENELDAALLTGQEVTNEQFVNAIFQGKNVDKSIAINWLKNATGSIDAIKAFELASGKVDIAGFTQGSELGVNIAKDPVKAFRTAAHELSHVATNELKYSNPTAYNELVSFFNDLTTQEGRVAMFEQLAKTSGLTEFDAVYQAGGRFDKNDPNYRERVMKEGVAALTEVLAHEAYKSDVRINPTIAKWLSFLPLSVQSALSRFVNKLTTFFGPQYPSLRHFLGDAEFAQLSKAFDKVVQFTRANDTAQKEAYKLLSRSKLIDEETFLDKVKNRTDSSDWKQVQQAFSGIGNEDFRDYALNFLKDSQLVAKEENAYEKWFFNPLFSTKLKPFTLDAFNELHHFHDKLKTYQRGFLEYIGQDDKKSLSSEQAINEHQKQLDALVASKPLQEKVNRVLSALLERRTKEQESGRVVVTENLLTKEEMISSFGLSEQQASFVSKLLDTQRLAAEQTLRFAEATDNVNLARLLLVQNRNQDINQTKAKASELTRVASDAGANLFQQEFYTRALEALSKDPSSRAQLEKVQSQIVGLRQQMMQHELNFETKIRQLFSGDFAMNPEPGKDFFVNIVKERAFSSGKNRAELKFISKDEGYFPLTRRGQYLLRVFNVGPENEVIKTTKEFKGFKTQKELNDYVKKNKLQTGQFEVVDKQELKNRVSLYTPRQVVDMRDRAKAELLKTIERVSKSREFANEQIRSAVLANLEDVYNSYKPLEQELNDVISVKGDKFRERRHLVPGFEENDFVPNMYEYLDYKMTSGQKALTKAEYALQMERPEIQADPALLQRLQTQAEYALSRTSEAPRTRKFIFYSYLGLSIKNALQNFLQLPMNAVPESLASGNGFRSYTDMLQAGALAAKWIKSGTTGDKTFDVLLKQAEADGNVIPNLIDAYAPSSTEIQGALDSIDRQGKGMSFVGQKVDKARTDFMVGFDKVMRSMSVASEGVNRRTSFLMSLLASKRKGVTDLKEMYNTAKQFTDYSNFVGSKANRPGFQVSLGKTFAHAPLLAATAMQSFFFNHVSQLYAFAKLAAKGDRNAAKGLAAGLGHLVIFGGIFGFVGASTAEQLLEEITDYFGDPVQLKPAMRKQIVNGMKETFNWSEEAGGRLADTAIGGLPALLGIDTGGSVGLGDPLLQFRAGEDVTALDLAGPGGSLVQRYGQTAVSAAKGDFGTAARQVPFKALNHAIKVYDAIFDGDYKSQKGAPVVQSLDGGASVATLLGFTPRQVSINRDFQNQIRKNERRNSEDYQSAVTKIARLLENFQQSGNEEDRLEAVKAFNEYVEKTAGTQDRDSMIKSIVQAQTRLRSPTTYPPSLKGQASFDEARATYPEAAVRFAPQLPEFFSEIESAQALEQTDVAVKKLSTAQQAVQRKALYDSLIEAGLSPARASALSTGNTEMLRKLIPASTSQSQQGPQ